MDVNADVINVNGVRYVPEVSTSGYGSGYGSGSL